MSPQSHLQGGYSGCCKPSESCWRICLLWSYWSGRYPPQPPCSCVCVCVCVCVCAHMCAHMQEVQWEQRTTMLMQQVHPHGARYRVALETSRTYQGEATPSGKGRQNHLPLPGPRSRGCVCGLRACPAGAGTTEAAGRVPAAAERAGTRETGTRVLLRHSWCELEQGTSPPGDSGSVCAKQGS